ncbi:MAG: hypothetical protein ACREJM_11180 [Candidatus Saccharimonadales bacterium]
MNDPDRFSAYRGALGNWSVGGYIQFELTEQAHRWLRRELGDITLKELGRQMFEYVDAGGDIDEVAETRPEWSGEYRFHHDLRLTIGGKAVCIETRLQYRLPVVADESWILVVNIHEC